MGQEEALKTAVNQISEDVEGKLDRMELAPLKDYFGELVGCLVTFPIRLSGYSRSMIPDRV